MSNYRILDNLKYIDCVGCKTEIRIPYIPQINAYEIPKIAKFVKELRGVVRVRILPYHNYAGSKYESLGFKHNLPKNIPSTEECEALLEKYF